MARKSKKEISEEYVLFLEAIQEGLPLLEIMEMLSLSRVQVNAHLLTAYKAGTLRHDDYKAKYELVRLTSLPNTLQQALLRLVAVKEGTNPLVKIEAMENGIFLSPHGIGNFTGEAEDSTLAQIK